jgi:RND family efflux transporter MFP subunit
MRPWTASRFAALAAFVLIWGAAACGRASDQAVSAESAATVQLSPENVVQATKGEITSGPAISGQLTPAREATMRAQTGGSIVALTVDRGQPVRTGQVLARISSRDLQSSNESAHAAAVSAETALSVATSELQRTEALVKGGALAARDLEQARNAVSTAQAQVAAAHARETSVQQQLQDTTVTAPFSGIVSARPASLGDVVTPGTELLTVIDPSSMRLEALVPSDQLQSITRGADVHFSIRGVPGDFVGTVDRISPSADPVTRQVSIFVTVPNSTGKLLAGLFAEGRVRTSTHEAVVLPVSAVDETGAVPTVTRVRDGKAERVAVTLGARQPETEQVEIASGVNAGDVVIVGSAKGVASGTLVKIVTSAK